MNRNRPKWTIFFTFVLALVLMLGLDARTLVSAQESTEEPPLAAPAESGDATEPATPAPEEPADEVAPTPGEEATDAAPASDEVPESTAEVTAEPDTETPAPAETPAPITTFAEDFENWASTSSSWIVNNWAIIEDFDGRSLGTTLPSVSAAIVGFSAASAELNASLAIPLGNTLLIQVNGHSVMFDHFGNSRIYVGDQLVASSAAATTAPDDSEEGFWYQVQIVASGNSILVSVAEVLTLQYISPTPLSASPIGFTTGSTNEALVRIDNISATIVEMLPILPVPTQPSAPVVVITPEAPAPVTPVAEVTEEPAAEVTDEPFVEVTEEPFAEVTEEPVAEVTEEPVAEVTEEPAAEVTEEPAAEVTQEPAAEVTQEPAAEVTQEPVVEIVEEAEPVLLLADDFEVENPALSKSGGAVLVADGEENHVLLMQAGAAIQPVVALSGELVTLNVAVNFLYEDSLLRISIGDAAMEVAASEAGSWLPLVITASGETLSVSLNGVPVAETVLSGGRDQFTIAAEMGLLLDDLQVFGIPAPLTVELSSEAEEALFDEVASGKMDIGLSSAIQAWLAGDLTEANAWLDDYFFARDEASRIGVELRLSANADADQIAAEIVSEGGAAEIITDGVIEAQVTLDTLAALAQSEAIMAIHRISRAIPTSLPSLSQATPDGAPAGAIYTQGFDVLGINAWHNANIRGSGIGIAVIDTGFNGTRTGANFSCLANTTPLFGTVGTSNHGLNVIEILCDIAPSSSVYMYRADSYSTLAQAIAQARLNPNIQMIVITLDLGVNNGPGDGSSGRAGAAGYDPNSDPYYQLAQARASGIPVISAAGNNQTRSAAFTVKTPNNVKVAEVAIRATAGDQIRIGWNDWRGDLNGATLEDFSFALRTSPGGTVIASVPASRSSASVPPGAMLTVPNSGTCAVPNPCNLILDVTRAAGNAGDIVVQVQVVPVQVSGETQTANVGVTGVDALAGTEVISNAGSIGRPGDSPDVITVGAVCARPTNNFPILPISSRGPVFAANGTAPTVTAPFSRSDVKPEIVSVSQVSTSTAGAAAGFSPLGFTGCNGTIGGLDGGGVFGGTSASAAHVAGMTALLLSNTSNVSMFDAFRAIPGQPNNADKVVNLLNYMQGRTTELPLGSAADGLDQAYGAGLFVLGLPSYDLARATNPGAAPDNVPLGECTNGSIYVGQTSFSGVPNGSISAPYYNPATALRLATDGQCVIVLPGEYTGSMRINGIANDVVMAAYNDFTFNTFPESIFSVQNQIYGTPIDFSYSDISGTTAFTRAATILVENGTNAFTVSGFHFILNPIYDQDASFTLRYPQAVAVLNTQNTTIRNNVFGRMTINGVTYPGWNSDEASIVLVAQNSHNTRIRGNTFEGNTASERKASTSVNVIQSGTNALPVRFELNVIRDNTAIVGGGTEDWNGIFQAFESYIDIVNNRFIGNQGETIVRVRTTSETAPQFARLLGNVFLQNTTRTTEAGANAGPMVSLFHVRNFYFMNNTVVRNNVSQALDTATALIARGDPNRSTAFGSNVNAVNQVWAIHNNLFYDNTLGATGIVADSGTPDVLAFVECDSFAGVDNRGAQFNLIYFPATPGQARGGICNTSMENTGLPNNGNILPLADPLAGENFLGQAPTASFDPDTDARYWAWRQINPTTYSIGVDAGSTTLEGLIGSPTFDRDINNILRALDISDWERGSSTDTGTYNVDIGAYEFNPLRANFAEYNPPPFVEDSGILTLNLFDPADLAPFALIEGGFGVVTISSGNPGFPLNFGTHCGPQFNNSNRGLVFSGKFAYYCPPRDFYNQGIADPGAAVTFVALATDEGGGVAEVTVNITISPDNADAALISGIGDELFGNPVDNIADTFDVFARQGTLGGSISVRLRPNVQFGNFRFSEQSRAEFNIGGIAQLEYPFQYRIVQVADPLTIISTPITTPTAWTDSATLNIDLSDSTAGEALITYEVRDKNNSTTTNYLLLRSIGDVPDREGIYDDASFAFTYTADVSGDGTDRGGWTPLSNTGTINNTLHRTNVFSNTATFRFVGTGFVLYMQQDGRGGDWEMRINGASTPGWTALTNNVLQASFAGGATCTTRAKTGTSTLYLTNRGNTSYTVNCDGLDPDTHEVKIINRTNGGVVQVDAFSLQRPSLLGEPLPPGMHDVDNSRLRSAFNTQWTETINARFSSGIAYQTTVANPDPVSFTIEGGVGVAVGTIFELRSATYTICVRNETSSQQTCQRFDNQPDGTRTRLTYNVFRPFFGLSAEQTYTVTIQDINVPESGRFIIDSVYVFADSEQTTAVISSGQVDDAEIDRVYFGSPLPNVWQRNFNNNRAYNGTSTATVPNATGAGPFLFFEVSPDIDTIVWNYFFDRRFSTQALICVDRHKGFSGAAIFGNCLNVDLLTGNSQRIDPTTGAPTGPVFDISSINGRIVIRESDFASLWGDVNRNGTLEPTESNSNHRIEIFSLSSQMLGLDRLLILGETTPLPAGYYEENITSIRYYNAAGVQQTPEVTESTRLTDYNAPFMQLVNRAAPRDSGSGVIYTKTPGNSIYFLMEGNGFAPRFRIERDSDAVRLCWTSYTPPAPAPDVLTVLSSGNCQVIDNEYRALTYQVDRPVLGLASGFYAVAIQMLDDNFDPAAHTRLPINMWFDGVTIYEENWTATTPLLAGSRYESRFNFAERDGFFQYFGGLWQSFSGARANGRSAQNYDQTNRIVGGTVVFQTQNASAVTFYRDVRNNYSPALFCAAPLSDLNDRKCTLVSNAGNGLQQPIVVRLNDAGIATPHLVSVTAMDPNIFIFDAIEPVGVLPSLTAGIYDDSHPGLYYDTAWKNLIPNGDMEVDGYWSSVGSATSIINTRSRYLGRASRTVQTSAASAGIESTAFNLENGKTYTAIVRVFIEGAGTVRMQLPGIGEFTERSTSIAGTWMTLRETFLASTDYSNVRLRILADAPTIFYVDDVSLNDGGRWLVESRRDYYGGSATRSQTHGATMSFRFFGTGFALGTLADNTSGEIEICYGPGILEHCFIYQNEYRTAQYGITRTVVGLPLGTYDVRMRDVEDGYSLLRNRADDARVVRNAVGRLTIDFVQIFDEQTPPAIPDSLTGNQDLTVNGLPALQVLPNNKWAQIAARRLGVYTRDNYVAMIDENGRETPRSAGPVAAIKLDLINYSEATVVFYSDAPARNKTEQLLACVDHVDGRIVYDFLTRTYSVVDSNNCFVTDALQRTPQVVFNADKLPLLGVGGAERVLTVRSLSFGPLVWDGFQVLYDDTLRAGYYEESIGYGGPGSKLELGNPGNWTLMTNRSYSSQEALQTLVSGETLTFTFEGTGFSILTDRSRLSGAMQINVSNGGSYNETFTVDTFSTSNQFQAGNTYAGLPYDTYTVTITAQLDPSERLVVDAVQIYGELQQLGSLYDNAQTKADGTPYLTYGPDNFAWTTLTGRQAAGALNETLHQTRSLGAALTFEMGAVEPALGILLYTGRTTRSNAEVCFHSVTNPDNRYCGNFLFIGGGRQLINGAALTPQGAAPAFAMGNYNVSIVTTDTGILQVDAVQILETTLSEGIFDVLYLNTIPNSFDTGTWTINTSTSTAVGQPGARLDFEMRGIGFAITLNETGATSADRYQVCIDGNCETVNSLGSGARTIVYAGLHSGSGENATRQISIENIATNGRPMNIREVHVLGAGSDLQIETGPRVENNAPQIRYLPFGSLNEAVTRAGTASGNSQHVGNLKGATVYFEFDDAAGEQAAVEYGREIATRYGTVEMCYGRISADQSSNSSDSENRGAVCEVFANNVGRGSFQSVAPVLMPSADYCGTLGCWVTIRNTDGRPMPFDFARITDTSTPLSTGLYQESYPLLKSFTFDPFGSIYTETEAINASIVADARASGGFVRSYVASGSNTALNGGSTFLVEGTGFTVYFTMDRFADDVRICYRGYSTTAPSIADTINGGVCQVFDNQDKRTTYQAARSILGLVPGKYRVTVQLLRDNLHPLVHAANELPLSMQLDAVEVYNDLWFSLNGTNWNAVDGLRAMVPGTRYELNAQRAASDQFVQYFGNWRSVSGAAANAYSGRNFDEAKAYGASVVFRTSGANAIHIYREAKRNNSPLLACATPVNLPLSGFLETSSIAGARRCQIISSEGRIASAPYTFVLGNAVDEYVVTLSTLNSGQFRLDAIEAFNTTAPLAAGYYEDTNPSLRYDSNYQQFIYNRGMEVDGFWANEGSVLSNTYDTRNKFEGRASRSINANPNGGIQSEPFTLGPGTYTAQARVLVPSGNVALKLVSGGGVTSIAQFTDVDTTSIASTRWVTLRQTFTLTTGTTLSNLRLKIVAVGGGAVFNVDDVVLNQGSEWRHFDNRNFSGGTIMQSQHAGATLNFTFEGTGFEIGLFGDRSGGEVEICYGPTLTTQCFTYQQERSRAEYTTSRSIVGLPFGVYNVRIRDVENGFTVLTRNPLDARPLRTANGQLGVDFVRIYGDALPPVTPAGYYNESEADSNGTRYLQALPEGKWSTITGNAASRFTGGSYLTPANPNTGRPDVRVMGPTALLRVNVNPGEPVTLVLYTGPAARRNTNQVLICAGDTLSGGVAWDGTLTSNTNGTCTLKSTWFDTQIVVSSSDLTALGQPGIQKVMISTLNQGNFVIDAFQIINGTTLGHGIYDEFFPDSLLNFTTPGNPQLNRALTGCNFNTDWCLRKDGRAYGGFLAATRAAGATLAFDIEGTGFSVITKTDRLGIDMRICYKRSDNNTSFPAPGAETPKIEVDMDSDGPEGIWCDLVTTDLDTRGTFDWNEINLNRLLPRDGNQYGFAYYGLPAAGYSVELRVLDATIDAARDLLTIDAIAVFSDPTERPVLQPGLYDDTHPALSYEPSVKWTSTTSRQGPPRGPYNLTEQFGSNAGTIVQFVAEGNAVALFQTTDTRSSADARFCLLITSVTIHCTEQAEINYPAPQEIGDPPEPPYELARQMGSFSQNGRRTFFVPVMFYGMGEGEHVIVIENRDNDRRLSVDGVLILR